MCRTKRLLKFAVLKKNLNFLFKIYVFICTCINWLFGSKMTILVASKDGFFLLIPSLPEPTFPFLLWDLAVSRRLINKSVLDLAGIRKCSAAAAARRQASEVAVRSAWAEDAGGGEEARSECRDQKRPFIREKRSRMQRGHNLTCPKENKKKKKFLFILNLLPFDSNF